VFDRRRSRFSRLTAASLIAALAFASVAKGKAPDTIRDNLYAVSFATPKLGWACGAFGSIVHTSDGGKTWSQQSSTVREALYSVDFPNDRLGWAVGRSGVIVHTSSGGATWRGQTAPSAKHLFSVDFVDETFGMAVGDWGVILVTEDGGQTWVDRSLPEDLILNAVSVVSRETALIAGEIGAIFRTDDGGRTWNRLESGIDKTLFGVRCVDAQRCWAVGIDALILRTADGGTGWELLHGSAEVRQLEQVGFGQAFENPSIYAIDVAGSFGVAAGEIGSVFVSRDGGIEWVRLDASKNWALPWFRDLVLLDGESGTIVGARGRRIMIDQGRIELDTEGE
jgi:photosystem II stability/assembly factor-like uncharacterized protein